jgi:hypothetical protein
MFFNEIFLFLLFLLYWNFNLFVLLLWDFVLNFPLGTNRVERTLKERITSVSGRTAAHGSVVPCLTSRVSSTSTQTWVNTIVIGANPVA